MSYYEHIFLLRGDLSTNQVEDTQNKYKDLIENHKGKITKTEYWGLRNLAYKVKKNKKAHYCLFNISCDFDCLKELKRHMSVNENILRQLTLKKDVLDNTPSIMMKQQQYNRYNHQQKDGQVVAEDITE